MDPETYANKALKILTIDGGGLQAISTLLILDKLLTRIAENNKVLDRKPRPCDVFDCIAGIGAGGWLALLLGRFHMDIPSCLSEWYKITQSIAPRSKSEEMRMRVFQHCYFDSDRLVGQIDQLTDMYGTGECLFSDERKEIRTRHVFVAALRADAKSYNLFRTYPIPKDAKLRSRLLDGPQNPEMFKLSSAFGVTGAAKYFTPPWKEEMQGNGRVGFSDMKFPKPHNITELALDEMWGIYGTDVRLSVIVNIGPGTPHTVDVRHIARRFSWGLTVPHKAQGPGERQQSPGAGDEHLSKKGGTLPENKMAISAEGPVVKFQEPTTNTDVVPQPGVKNRPIQRTNTFGSIKDRKSEVKMKRAETQIESDIKKKLDQMYEGGSKIYYRLALDQAPRGTTQNDASASGAVLRATKNYLPQVSNKIDNITLKMRQNATVPVAG